MGWLLACGPAAPSSARRQDPPAVQDVWRQVEPELRAAAPQANWMAVRTPLLPSEWPPSPRTRWMRYHYAAGAERQLLDGVRVASPHAVETVRRDGKTAEVDPLPRPPVVTTQGVRPMSGALDGPTPDEVERIALGLTALPAAGSEDERIMREHYAGWFGRNGVTAEPLRARHETFFLWVEARDGTVPPR